MLSNFSQYSPQGLVSPQGAGWPQMGQGLFGQPGVNSGNVLFGQEFGQAGFAPQYPFGLGGQGNVFAQNPLTTNPFWHSPFGVSPYLQNNPLLGSIAGQQAPHHTQHLISLLGQIAQQLYIHNAMTQQVGIALHQLVQQLAAQGYSGSGLGAGGGQYFGQQNPFAGMQGGYGGFNPQAAQAWGASRPQTIQ
jgi:hypothetical protein